MVAPLSAADDVPPVAPSRRLRHRAAYLVIALLLLSIVALLPFALESLVRDFRHIHTPEHTTAAIQGRSVERGNVAVDLIGMNEWEGDSHNAGDGAAGV